MKAEPIPVYQTDAAGYFVGTTMADPDPMTPGFWLIPGGCALMPPPAHDRATTRCRWDGLRWIPEPIPAPEPSTAPLWSELPDSGPHNQDWPSPVNRLAAFLAANPDVAALLPKE